MTNGKTILPALGIALLMALARDVQVPAQTGLTIIARIALPNVRGRIDHLAFDAGRKRLFVAALGNNTLEVIDTVRNAALRSLGGFHEPQGLAVVPDLNGVAVANGDTGTLQFIDMESYQTRWTTPIGSDADNVRFDPGGHRLYVAAEGGLSVVDPASGKVVQRIQINGHPESFQLDPKGSRLFANLPGASEVIVADRARGSVTGRWPTGNCQANYPMALDESMTRLFVGCRRPATVTLFDTGTGKRIASVPAVGDTDDLFYDGARQRLYVIGGEGFVEVLERENDVMRRAARLPTREGARTGVWVSDPGRLYVAAPQRGRASAEVIVFTAS